MDVFLPGPGGAQIHDLNPSAFPPLGLFWTIEIPDEQNSHGNGADGKEEANSIEVELGRGSATMQVSKVPIIDYGNIGNALFGGGPAPVPGSVSFKVVWQGVRERVNIRNTDKLYGGFAGEFVRNTAQMEWTATVGDYTFASDPLDTSSSSFAEIGHERNGSFFS